MNEKQQAALKLYLESATIFNEYTPDSDAVIALKLQEAGIQSSKTSVERWRKQFDFKGQLEIRVSAALSQDQKVRDLIAKAGDDALIDKTVEDLSTNNRISNSCYTILEDYLGKLQKRETISHREVETVIKIASLTTGREDKMWERGNIRKTAEIISKGESLKALSTVDVEFEDDVTEADVE